MPFIIFSLLCAVCRPALAQGVVVTIQPLHALVAGVMGKTDTPALLIRNQESPHNFSLKPSQVRLLRGADMVFYVSDRLEPFIKPVVPVPNRFAFAEEADLELIFYTEEDDDAYDISEYDMHVWLSPGNAKRMVQVISGELGLLYPQHAQAYETNAQAMMADLDAMDAVLKQKLSSVKNRPFVVFHDAYRYFQQHFGLTSVGVITLEPEAALSAQRIRQLREKIDQSSAVCIFSEPQFSDRSIQTIIADRPLKVALLDPLGVGLMPGRQAYFDMMTGMAQSFYDCLSP